MKRRALGRLLLAGLAVLAAGCDDSARFAYLDSAGESRMLGSSIEVAEGTEVAVVFLVSDRSDSDGVAAGEEAYSGDASVVRVVPATREGTVYSGATAVTGRVFVVQGLAPGETTLDVHGDGASKGSVRVVVRAQSRR